MRPLPPTWIVDLAPPVVSLCWLGVIVRLVVLDQIALSPPGAPTPAQVIAATPGAKVVWRLVYARLLQRLPKDQPRPPQLGAVWATRSGQVCGFVDRWNTGVDVMTPFYTVDMRPRFKGENARDFVTQWSQCRFDPWVRLHSGGYEEGACVTGRYARLCR